MNVTHTDAAKRLLRRVLPRPALNALRGVRAWLAPADLSARRRRRAFERWNQHLPTGEMALRPGLELKVEPEARDGFEQFAHRSAEMVEELSAFLAATPSHRALLDVGACHGLFTLAFTKGRPEATAVAVEPSAAARSVLEANLRANSIATARVYGRALGAARGVARMVTEWHHLVAVASGEVSSDTQDVPVETADDICSELAFRPDIVKIDVEGYEHEVLRGAERLLQSGPTLFLEVHPARLATLGSSADALLAPLERLGYEFDAVAGQRLRRSDLAAMSSVFRIVCRRVGAR